MRLRNNKGQAGEGLAILVGIVLLIVVIAMALGSYRVETGRGVILTESNGERVAVTDVGWHTKIPILASIEEYSLVSNNLYFPADYLELEQKFQGDKQTGAIGIDIKTPDGKVLDVGVVMKYKIVDLFQFGVMNAFPLEQLQKDFESVASGMLQSQLSDVTTEQLDTTAKAVYAKLKASNMEKQYGIEITGAEMVRSTYTQTALAALAEKQAIQARSEGELNAAKNRAAAIELIANAQKKQADILSSVPKEQLDFNAKLTLYDALKGNQNVIWVIPEGQSIVLGK